jgi:phage gp16-like protein
MNARPDTLRNRELAMIHIGAEQLGMDTKDKNPDSDYHTMLWTVARVRSAGDLDFTTRKRVLEHLRSRGFKPRAGKNADPDRPRNLQDPVRGPSLKKIGALLADAGRRWRYAHSMAKRMFHVDRCDWLDVDQLHSIIAALVIDQRRRAAKGGK